MVKIKPQFKLSKAVTRAVKEATKLADSYTAGDEDAVLVSAVRLKTMAATIISDYDAHVKDSMKG